MNKRDLLIQNIADAVATYNGYWIPKSPLVKAHNPGAIRCWPGYREGGEPVQFRDSAEGWNALRSAIGVALDEGLKLADFTDSRSFVFVIGGGSAEGFLKFLHERLWWYGWFPMTVAQPLKFLVPNLNLAGITA